MKIKKDLREKVKKSAIKQVRKLNTRGKDDINLYMNTIELPKDHILNAGRIKHKVKRKSVFVLADLAPKLNWSHPCKHMLFDAETGELYDEVQANLPPAEFYIKRNEFDGIHTPVKLPIIAKERALLKGKIPGLTNALVNARGNRFAILFSGMSDNRHTNDLEFIYRTLIDVYGFNAANIQVLNYDGTLNYSGAPNPIGNWPGDNTAYRMPIDARGGDNELRDAIRSLNTQIKDGDFLFIHTNNHGGHDGTQSDLCCYPNWDSWTASEYGTELAALPAYDVLMVMMEQCHSGGFMDETINNSTAKWTHFSAACREDKNSIGGADFDPFAYDWIAGVTGQYGDGSALNLVVDSNADGRISASEAHTYADADKDPYDTPVTDETPAGCGDNIFLGYPAHDLFVRDNLQDFGREPLIGGGICASPDIIIYNQELLDPDATLGTQAAMKKDYLGEPVEYGQDNYIYIRVQNRGSSNTAGNVKLYWSPPSTFPTPGSWNYMGEVAIPSLSPNEARVIGPIKWKKNDIPAIGHYCFVALVNSGSDPAPDLASITSLNAFHNFIRANNNATWKNFNVIDMFAGTTNSWEFHIQGWPGIWTRSDFRIDLSELPVGGEITFRILKRLTEGSKPEGMKKIRETTNYVEYKLSSNKVAYLRNMNLKPSDNTIASLKFLLPDNIKDGGYRIHVAQFVNNLEVGRITQLIEVGDHALVGNRNSKELHLPECIWVSKMTQKNKIAYDKVSRAINSGFNGCRFCLPEYDKG